MKILYRILHKFYEILQKAERYTKNQAYRKLSNCCIEDGVCFFEESNLQHMSDGQIFIGSGSRIRGELVTFPDGGNISIGKNCYLGHRSIIWSEEKVLIGDRVLISHNCNVFDNTTHPIDSKIRAEHVREIFTTGHPDKRYETLVSEPVIIEDDVWICCNCTILKGVHIGEGAIISTGSIVTKDVEAHTLVGGNPAKFIKSLV